MNERDRLIEELRKAGHVPGFFTCSYEQIADWVIADRKRIAHLLLLFIRYIKEMK